MFELEPISFIIGIFAFPMICALLEFVYYVFEFSCNYKEYKEWKKKNKN